MKTTREKVMQALLSKPRSTVQEIADVVGINGISVRHHINALLADNLISTDEERHGVGRPRLVYYLTEAGQEKFPTSYLRLTGRLLSQLKSSMPPALVDSLFTSIALDLSQDYMEKAKTMNLEEKLDLITTLLSKEGFSVEWEKQGANYLLVENSCPYYHVGQEHPEVCNVDKTMIASILSIPVEKISCVLGGGDHCSYLIKPETETSR
jgi:predicted ArsR family transcriptional regulator